MADTDSRRLGSYIAGALRAAGGALHAFEMLRGVAVEVEAELGDAALQHAPHRLAKIGHELHHRQRGEALLARIIEISVEQNLILSCPEFVVDGQFGEVEETVAHPRLLPADYPDRPLLQEFPLHESSTTPHP